MNMPGIERSRVDPRWCVYSRYFEGLCPFWAIPVLLVMAVFAQPPRKIQLLEILK